MATPSDSTARQISGRPPTDKNGFQGNLVEYEQFIDDQLRKTRSHVRGVDLAGSLMTLAAGTLAYFFLAGIVDHWIIPGGLGFAGRLIFLALYALAAVYYVCAQVLPLLLRRINPVYAAHTIERSRPSLKNGLVNFLLFRANPRGLPPVVYQAIEEQAATNLAKVRVEAAVDRSKLIHIGYALVGILLACALYTLLSPKDLLKTVGRVVMPWAEINAPTRTAIVEIEPGDASAFRGQQVAVAARIHGLPSGGKVILYYTTADGQTVDRAVEMNLPLDGYQHACVLPAGDSSLQQSLAYRIEAGDAITRAYRIEVVAAPTIVVQNVAYKYPPYTGLLAQSVEHQGDVKAIEGTEITIRAVANQDIQSAQVDFDCDGKLDLRMQTDKQQANATFVLALRDDRKTPLHDCYQLIFKNDQGQQNPQPVRHQIEVTRDLPPEIQFVAPKKDEIDLPSNGAVELEVVANDPDFALRTVKLSATSLKRPLVDKLLLDEVWRGQFGKKFRFDARKLGLKSGDVVEYSALAEDNKDPRPNRTETAKRRIRIVSPDAQPSKSDQLAQNRQQGDTQQPGAAGDRGDNDHPRDNDQPPDNDQGDQNPQKSDPQNAGKPADRAPSDGGDQRPGGAEQDADNQQADKAEAGQRQGGKSDKPGQAQPSDPQVPNDGSDDGSAIEQILKHREEQNKPDSKASDDRRQQRQAEQQKSGEKEKSGDKDDARPRQPGQDGKDAPSPEPGKRDQSADGEPKSDAQQDDNEPAGQQPGDEQAGDKQAGDRGAEKSPRPANKQPDKSDRSQGQFGQKGSGAGDNGQGNDSGGGQEDEKGQSGQKGQSGKSPSQGKGKGDHPGDAGDNPAGQKSQQGGKAQGKSGDSKSGGSKAHDKAGRDDAAEKGQGAEQGQSTSPDKPQAARNPQATDDPGQGQSGKSQSRAAKPTGKSDSAAEGRGDKPDGDAKSDKQPADRDAGGSEARDESTPDASHEQGDAKPGQGEKSKGDASREAKQESLSDKQKSDAKGGDGEQEQGVSGAGQKGQDNKGSPSPMDQNQPRDKSQRASPDEKDPKQGDDAQSPSNSQKESDSQGLDDGDRSGGGKKGGGQKANKSGSGGAGQNTPADEGAGRSDEAGQGETSPRAGGDRKADKKTGRSGSQSGEGSAAKPSPDGDKPGSGKSSQGAGSGSKSPGAGGESQQNQSGSQPSGTPGDGKPGQDAQRVKQKWQPGQDQADQANLEYARKSTDLAIEHLKDELRKDRPDPELLNRLGWTKKDLESFVKRWEQMRQQSQAAGEKGARARQELDEALRSLGLRPRATSMKSKATRDDQLQGVKESRHTTPPPEYLEQSKAYSQGTARGGK